MARARLSRKLALLALAALAVGAAARLTPADAWLSGLGARILGMGPAGMLLYGAFYVAAALLFAPGVPLTLGAGFLFGVGRGMAVVSAASTSAAAIAFLVARRLARSRVERLARRNARFAAIDRAIGRQGWKMVALLRLSPLLPFGLSNYLYGLTPVRWAPYVLASWLAMLPQTALYVSIGAAGASLEAGSARATRQWVPIGIGIAATAAAAAVLARAARRELARNFPPSPATASEAPEEANA
ncbi:MAG: TVP38/TMEM64 family protein [Acidobacteriota bacterium]